MADQFTPFAFDDNLVRGLTDDKGDPWLVAKDVCRVLELGNVTEALRNLDEDEKADLRITEVSSNGVTQARKVNTISESGLYALIFRSRKPQAKHFRKWVTSQVLPALRKTGSYSMPTSLAASAPFDLPPEAKRLRPSVKSNVLNVALQAAKMGSNTQEEIDHLFRRYCLMVGCPASSPNNLPSLPPVLALVRQWTKAVGFEQCEQGEGRKVQCKHLYLKCCEWCAETNMPTPSLRLFGEAMQQLFACTRSNKVYYWIKG